MSEINNEKYDYEAAVKSDIADYLNENAECHIDEHDRDRLYDEMFISDSVTGNGSGSYTFNTWRKEWNDAHPEEEEEEEYSEEGGVA